MHSQVWNIDTIAATCLVTRLESSLVNEQVALAGAGVGWWESRLVERLAVKRSGCGKCWLVGESCGGSVCE